MIKSNTCIDSLIAQYHEQVWEAAEKGGVAYDEAGLNVAKAILAKISAVEAERDQYRIAEQHQLGLRKKVEDERDALAAHVSRLRRAMTIASNEHIGFAKRISQKCDSTAMQAVDKADSLLVRESYHVPVDTSCLAQRDAKAQTDILRECIGELTSEALKTHRIGQQYTADMAMALITRKCHALHHLADGGNS